MDREPGLGKEGFATIVSKPAVTRYGREVEDFKRKLLTEVLREHGGNRTHAARALGLQRTYLLRLIRQLEIRVPNPTRFTTE
jgi:transcriptional regulator with GAF, ATPase, and Fis domain